MPLGHRSTNQAINADTTMSPAYWDAITAPAGTRPPTRTTVAAGTCRPATRTVVIAGTCRPPAANHHRLRSEREPRDRMQHRKGKRHDVHDNYDG